jgi:hypothetical protein
MVANSFIIGTIIIVAGFIWMITEAIVIVPLDEVMVAFFFTISGLIFWGLGIKYQNSEPKTNKEKK